LCTRRVRRVGGLTWWWLPEPGWGEWLALRVGVKRKPWLEVVSPGSDGRNCAPCERACYRHPWLACAVTPHACDHGRQHERPHPVTATQKANHRHLALHLEGRSARRVCASTPPHPRQPTLSREPWTSLARCRTHTGGRSKQTLTRALHPRRC
jgi:hypothetical protein